MLRSIHARRFVVYDCYSLDVISHYIVDLNRHSWSFFVSHFFQNNIVSCKRAYIDIEIQDTEVLERSGILFYTTKNIDGFCFGFWPNYWYSTAIQLQCWTQTWDPTSWELHILTLLRWIISYLTEWPKLCLLWGLLQVFDWFNHIQIWLQILILFLSTVCAINRS